VNPDVKPVWLAHSSDDQVVPVRDSDALFDELRQLNGDVTYSRYSVLNHVETWERVYDSSMLYDWFLRQ
jgi:predicted peptidase